MAQLYFKRSIDLELARDARLTELLSKRTALQSNFTFDEALVADLKVRPLDGSINVYTDQLDEINLFYIEVDGPIDVSLDHGASFITMNFDPATGLRRTSKAIAMWDHIESNTASPASAENITKLVFRIPPTLLDAETTVFVLMAGREIDEALIIP